MPDEKPERDLVLFLGAGFSEHADLPTMDQFGKASEDELESAKRQRRPQTRRKGAEYERAGQVCKEFREYCERANRGVTINPDNMEDVFCMAETMREAGVAKVPLRSGEIDLEDLLRQIRIWLWKIYQRNPPVQDKGEQKKQQEPYKRLLEALRDKKLGGKTTVVTTNYDLVFETYASKYGLPCTYAPRPWIALRAGQRDDSYLADDDAGAPLVLKLHGSVNFFAQPGGRDGGRLGIVVDLWNPGEKIGKSRTRSTRPAFFAYDVMYALEKKYGLSLGDPAIVPPTYAKLQGYPWLRHIWARAFEALRDAEKIIFIGYSMPESDGFMKAMFRSAMAARVKEKPACVYVFDPDPKDEVLTRYEEFFQPLSLTHDENLIRRSFEDSPLKIEEVLAK